MLIRLLLGTSALFFSLILGAIALAVVGYNAPEALSGMLGWARDLKGVITTAGLEPKYNIWVELLLEERQLLFMFFTVGARLFLGLVGAIFAGLTGN
jgi:hypothetical protein